MIIATVTTCPQRWPVYQKLLKRFGELHWNIPLRTFQTAEEKHHARMNNNLNARAALRYCRNRFKANTRSWVLYLEDDVLLHDAIQSALPQLLEISGTMQVDCWYLCNRRIPIKKQYKMGSLTINEADYPIFGTHALLIPQEHLDRLLTRHWRRYCDEEIFAALREVGGRILQVVDPVLVEHKGKVSTIHPKTEHTLEINYADSSNSG